jgi:hypothetical protein
MNEPWNNFFAWSAYLAAVFSILGFLALFIFFAVGGVFGTINDALSVFQFLFLIPVALALYLTFRERWPALSGIVSLVAILAMGIITVLQIALVFGLVRFEQTIGTILIVGSFIGLWWIVIGILMRQEGLYPAGLGWAGIIAGASFIIIAIGFVLEGPQHPLAAVGFLFGAIAMPVWAFWLGRLWLNGSVSVPA